MCVLIKELFVFSSFGSFGIFGELSAMQGRKNEFADRLSLGMLHVYCSFACA
jgi:hypothetical protein